MVKESIIIQQPLARLLGFGCWDDKAEIISQSAINRIRVASCPSERASCPRGPAFLFELFLKCACLQMLASWDRLAETLSGKILITIHGTEAVIMVRWDKERKCTSMNSVQCCATMVWLWVTINDCLGQLLKLIKYLVRESPDHQKNNREQLDAGLTACSVLLAVTCGRPQPKAMQQLTAAMRG